VTYSLIFSKCGIKRGFRIIYRKYWYILFKRLFLPTAILFLNEFSFLANLFNFIPLLSAVRLLVVVLLANLTVGSRWYFRYLD